MAQNERSSERSSERSPGRKTASAGRGTYAVGDERRSRILDAAVEHFAQWGFHASSLARIAKDVGITQGGLLHHFRSKEDLLVQVLARADENDKEKFFSHEFVSAVECYACLVRLAEYNSTRFGRTRMFNVLAAEAGDPGHPAHAYFTRRYTDLVEHMSGPLRQAVESGELKPGTDIVAVSQETAAVMDGLQVQWVLDPKGFDMVGRFRAYADRLLRSITVDGRGLPADV
ncbi:MULTISPECIES: TetR/AcrR family transcriptional regulator [unclassified Streptomyces]|uniref:TetR/AcrR family transcriptional regulator n=1 Tax=unclassified Streptomyces TaxID=2593676 RepID=UPI002E82459A|nr:TetR/AcrR family transcriptional regulator [Streptomyces sp. NBC_00589]WTI36298.1 TetR/AcrR family transcriptional regulator [Streptomyces sp. NBC_00775]WUB30027.1 TetR/AcrR family transcriptional regulator [Streptomyces sp. NBC_00589]